MDPSTFRYAETHEWVHLEADLAIIGISQFAADQLTDLTMLELPEVGQSFNAGESMGVIETVKAVSDVYAPIAGEVVEVNQDAASDMQLIVESPHERGWLVKLKPTDVGTIESLMDHEAYQKQIADQA